MAYNIEFLRGASSAGAGAVFKTDGRDLVVAQVSGSFTSVRVALEGRTTAGEGAWERIGVFKVTDPDNTLPAMSEPGIYECPIFGLAEIRFNVLSVVGGSVSVAGVFYDTTTDNFYPYETEGVNMMQMGGSNLFVKGVAEQIFMDPTTGNIVGYDRTATNASVATQVNLQEIVGGMGNRLVGVLPDTVRINGTYESAAFSLETREKIMGGSIAYDAVASVCEKITADDSGELVVSQKPAPFYGEDSLPDERIPVYRDIADVNLASFAVEESDNLKSLTVNIQPTQRGTGEPDPDNNIRPISGLTGVKITRCGKNLFDKNAGGYKKLNIASTQTSGSTSGTVTGVGYSAAWVPLPGGVTYAIKCPTRSTSVFRVTACPEYPVATASYKSPVLLTINQPGGPDKTNTILFNAPEGTKWIGISLYLTSSTDVTSLEEAVEGLQIEVASASTAYEEFNGTHFDVAFPAEAGTVYAGTLDVLTGTLTVTHLFKQFDGTETWELSGTESGQTPFFYCGIPDTPHSSSTVGWCSHFPYRVIRALTSVNGVGALASVIGGVSRKMITARPGNLVDTPISTVADWTNWLAGQAAANTPLQVVYPLHTPQTYSMTPMQIKTILRTNNVWGDAISVQTLRYLYKYDTVEPDGNVFRAYVTESGVNTHTGEAYGVESKTRKVVGFVPEEGKTYEVTYSTHNASASMLPIPTMWNPVIMTVQVKYGVYAKQGVGDKENRGVLKGWLYFIVPRAMLTADAGVNASQTGTATTDGSWMALTNKAENLPMCSDCGANSDPMAYYVYVPCGDMNESVVAILSVGGGMVLSPGQKKQLPIKLLMPDDTLAQPDFTTLNYLSDDDAVATVDTNGEVTGVGTGSTIINTSLALDDGTVLSCKTMVVIN